MSLRESRLSNNRLSAAVVPTKALTPPSTATSDRLFRPNSEELLFAPAYSVVGKASAAAAVEKLNAL